MKLLWAFVILGVFLVGKVDGFSCLGIGRFENEYDPKCQTYYVCGETPEGTLHKCPDGQLFDTNTKTCSEAYTCTKPTFACQNSGYHADLGDTSCTRYFNCYNFFGFYFKFTQYCSPGEQFDPNTRVCSKSYDCGAYTLVSEELIPTIIPTNKLNVSSLSAPYSSALTAEFTCTAMGLFADPNDPNCSIYFYCLPKTGGIFTKRQYKCPKFFDPETKKCSVDYACPHLSSSVTTSTTSTTPTTVITEASTSQQELVVGENVPLVGDAGEVDSNDEKVLFEGLFAAEVLSGSVANSTVDTFLEDDATLEVEFECTVTGRYPNNLDATCTEYFLCSKLRNGTFLRTSYTCPTSSFFDPGVKRCSKTYTCTSISTTTESILRTTVEDVMTTMLENEVTTEGSVDFMCSSTGRFPDLSDFTCKKYFLCSRLSNGTFLKTPYSCPASNFDPINRVCSKSYACPYMETTIPTTEIILETTTEGIWDFSCDTVGRFRNLNDRRCNSYFLCNQLRNGTFIQTEYNCPTTSIFDRSIHMCSTQVSCM